MANGIFRKVTVTGSTKEEALANAPFQVTRNATQAYKNWSESQTEPISEEDTKAWMVDYLNQHFKGAAGIGAYIVLQSAVVNTRERPYKVTNVKNDGTRKFKTFYLIKDRDTKAPLTIVDGTQGKAEDIVKEMYKKGLTANVEAEVVKLVVNGEKIAFTADYTPSTNAVAGTYVAFGNIGE